MKVFLHMGDIVPYCGVTALTHRRIDFNFHAPIVEYEHIVKYCQYKDCINKARGQTVGQN